jgi:hypothetical protein
LGNYTEMGYCDQHGDFQRKISEENLSKIVEWCRKSEPMNWIQATEIAYGNPGDNHEAYARQPGDVLIYNPENLPLSAVLVTDSDYNDGKIKVLAFDSVNTSGMIIYVPYYYSIVENLISGCPQCEKLVLKRE